MPDGFNVHVSGDAAYRAKLDAFEKQIDDLLGFWPLLVPIVHGWMSAQFDSEGSWGGEAWADLDPVYEAWKAQWVPGHKILSLFGDLRRAATSMKREATPRTLTMTIEPFMHSPFFRKERGTSDITSTQSRIEPSWFQDGTDRMPARPLIPDRLPPSAYRDIDLAGEEYVNVLVRQLGL